MLKLTLFKRYSLNCKTINDIYSNLFFTFIYEFCKNLVTLLITLVNVLLTYVFIYVICISISEKIHY